MSRLTPLDRALVLILVPLWVVCFSLGVRAQLRGVTMGMVGLSVEGGDQYPTLTGEFSSTGYRSDPLAEAGLLAGDRLIALGDIDLLGVDTAGFSARSLEESGPGLGVPLIFERDGERRETSFTLVSVSGLRPLLATSFAFAASALFLLMRGRPTPTVRAYFYAGMALAIANSPFPGSRIEFYAWLAIAVVTNSVMHPLALRFAFRFPDDRTPAGRWHRIWPWLFAVSGGPFFALMFTSWMAIGEVGGAPHYEVWRGGKSKRGPPALCRGGSDKGRSVNHSSLSGLWARRRRRCSGEGRSA